MSMTRGQTLDDRARKILKDNDRGGHTVPTDGLYPYQWNWDSAFAAFGFATFDINRAWTELDTLFSGQWSNGMVPHIIFHQPDDDYFPGPEIWNTKASIPSSGISQPPVAASFARKMFERDPVIGRDRIRDLYAKFLAWHQWFKDHRCESGAAAITHPWESGRDNAPDWDAAMEGVDPSGIAPYTRRDTGHVDPSMRPTKYDYDRYIKLVQFGREHDWDEGKILRDSPFRVADPTTTFTLLRAHRDLKWLGEQLGENTDIIDGWITDLEKGANTLWNAELNSYDSRDLRSGNFANSLSNASFLCWYAGIENDRMMEPLKALMKKVKYSVPSFTPDSTKFDERRYWRGPVWAIMNTLIAIGLRDAGHLEIAERLRLDTAELIKLNGFAEYYDPYDGTPAGGGTFTWTAAVWLGWASPTATEE